MSGEIQSACIKYITDGGLFTDTGVDEQGENVQQKNVWSWQLSRLSALFEQVNVL